MGSPHFRGSARHDRIGKRFGAPPQGGEAPPATLGPLKVWPFIDGYQVNNMVIGGEWREVDSLNQSGSGTLKDAMETAGEAVIWFSIGGGAIRLTGSIIPNGGKKAVLGGTAPAPITIEREMNGWCFPFRATHEEILIQHLRFREITLTQGQEHLDVKGCHKVIIANCSLCGPHGGNIDLGNDPNITKWFTLWRNILGPAPDFGSEGAHPYGWVASRPVGIWPANPEPSTCEALGLGQNLIAHGTDRGPSMKYGNKAVSWNNIYYNHGGGNYPDNIMMLQATGSWDTGIEMPDSFMSYRGIACIEGADKRPFKVNHSKNAGPGRAAMYYYVDDCGTPGGVELSFNTSSSFVDLLPQVSEEALGIELPTRDRGVLARTALVDEVLPVVGCWPSMRDNIDAALIADVIAGTGGRAAIDIERIHTLAEVDTHNDSPPANPNAQAVGEAAGWTVGMKWAYERTIANAEQ